MAPLDLPSEPVSARAKVLLVSSPARWAALSLGGLVLACVVTLGYANIAHYGRPVWTLAPYTLAGAVLLSITIRFHLRAEESRIARELRTTRTGTSVSRGVVLRRRQATPSFLKLVSCPLGQAAIALAIDDRDAALAALASSSPLMSGGIIERLRTVVEADLHRAAGTFAGRKLCIEQLRSFEETGHRETDLYRVHVLVRAVLEQGDAEMGELLHPLFVASSDDEVRVYGVWIRAWFELPPEPPIEDGIVRMALLLARSHGAHKLVERFEEAIRARDALSEGGAAPAGA